MLAERRKHRRGGKKPTVKSGMNEGDKAYQNIVDADSVGECYVGD